MTAPILTARAVRVTVELPAGAVVASGLRDALGDVVIHDDGTIRTPHPQPIFKGTVVGTWAVVEEPRG